MINEFGYPYRDKIRMEHCIKLISCHALGVDRFEYISQIVKLTLACCVSILSH